MITVYRWNGTTCERGGAERLPESAAAVAANEVVWVDLTEPTPEEESLIKSFRMYLQQVQAHVREQPAPQPEQAPRLFPARRVR